MIAWLGTICGIIGSLMLATGTIIPAYIVMLIGALCCILDSIWKRNHAMLVQFGFFAIINVIGLVHYAK